MLDYLSNFSLFDQGAEGKLLTGTFSGQPAIAKIRFKKKYRLPELDSQLTKNRLRSEVRSLIRCQALGIRTPTVYFVDEVESVIVMEYLPDAIRVRNYVDEVIKSESLQSPKLIKLMGEIGRYIGILHKNNLIHGDLTTSNILIKSESLELYLIDFGLGYAEGTAEDKGVDLYVLERALISTHPNTEFLFVKILEAYEKQFQADKNEIKRKEEIMKKYREIRLRGRKRCMEG